MSNNRGELQFKEATGGVEWNEFSGFEYMMDLEPEQQTRYRKWSHETVKRLQVMTYASLLSCSDFPEEDTEP